MRNLLFLSASLIGLAISPAAGATITVSDVGSILNQSVALPAEPTPGLGAAFAQLFEFSLPVREEVSVSVSDSGVGFERVVGGLLSLSDWTTTGPSPTFIPGGALIESTAFTNTVGGQEATVTPDVLSAGKYFAEVTGTSGLSPLKLEIDGTVTATTAIPEPRTWIMLAMGFGALAWAAARKSKRGQFAV